MSGGKTCLLLLRPQNDFFEGGPMAVRGAESIIEKCNELRRFNFDMTIIVGTSHPVNHRSFVSNNPGSQAFKNVTSRAGPRAIVPDHCIRETRGADFHPELLVKPDDVIVHVGMHPQGVNLSVLREEDSSEKGPLLDIIRKNNVFEVYIAGLELDKAVLHTALDARMLTEAAVYVVKDACAGTRDHEVRSAITKLKAESVNVIEHAADKIKALGAARELMIPTATDLSLGEDDLARCLLKVIEQLDVSRVHALLAASADRTRRPLPLGMNALQFVANMTANTHSNQARVMQIIKMLLDDAPLGYVDNVTRSDSARRGGQTALMLASAAGHVHVVKVLLSVGADVTLSDNDEHMTALMLACRGGHAEVTHMLMGTEAVSTLAYQNRYGQTALMFACSAADLRGRRAFEDSTAEWRRAARDPTHARAQASTQARGHRDTDDVIVVAATEEGAEKWGVPGRDVARAARVVKAVLAGMSTADVLHLARQHDVDGWTPLHFAAKTGLLQHVPWRRLMGDDFVARCGIHHLTIGGYTTLHLAVWNRQLGAVVTILHHMRGYDEEFSPWRMVVARNLIASTGDLKFTSVDLAVMNNDAAMTSALLRARVSAKRAAGVMMDEALERALLQFDSKAMEALLADEVNAVSTEMHAVALVQQIKFQSACTFSFARYNNPCAQHTYTCTVCDKQVCLVCATLCHSGPDHALTRNGLDLASPTFCSCARHSCNAGAPDEVNQYNYTPNPVDTSTIGLVVHKGAIVDQNQLADDKKSSKKPMRIKTDVDLLAEELGMETPVTGGAGDGGSSAATSVGEVDAVADIASALETDDVEGDGNPVDVAAGADLIDHLVKVLARQAHTDWAIDRAMTGWSFAATRDNKRKHHPLLMPFDELHYGDAKYNCDAAMKTLRLIAALKFQVRPPPSRTGTLDWGVGDGRVSADLDAEARRVGGAKAALLRRLGVDRIDVSDVHLLEEHRTLVELLARNYHEEWAAEQFAKGYVYAPEGTVMDSLPTSAGADGGEPRQVQKTNHLLIPFELLPSQYQQSNRSSAESTVKLMLKLGNKLTPNSLEEYNKIQATEKQLKNEEAQRLRVHQEGCHNLKERFWVAILTRAARRGDTKLVQAVMGVSRIDPTPSINCYTQHLLATPLHLAARFGHADTVKCLLALGAQVEAKDVQGLTPLAMAAFERRRAVVRLLLRVGADPSTYDYHGFTPLHHAAYNNSYDIARLLVRQLKKLKDAGQLIVPNASALHAASRKGLLSSSDAAGAVDVQGAVMVQSGKSVASRPAETTSVHQRARLMRRSSRHRLMREISEKSLNIDDVDPIDLVPTEHKNELTIDEESLRRVSHVKEEVLPPLTTTERVRLLITLQKPLTLDMVKRRYELLTTGGHGPRADQSLLPEEEDSSWARARKRVFAMNRAKQHKRKVCKFSPLAMAVKARHPEMVDLLLRNGADPTRPDLTGISPYERALRSHAISEDHKVQLTTAIAAWNEAQKVQLEQERKNAAQAQAQQQHHQQQHAGELSIALPTDNHDRLEEHRKNMLESRKRDIAYKKAARRSKELSLLINLLNQNEHVAKMRRSYALWEVAMRIVLFAVVLLAFTAVSPFAPDFSLSSMHTTRVNVHQAIGASFGEVHDTGLWWEWMTTALTTKDYAVIDAGEAAATQRPAGAFSNGSQILQQLTPGGVLSFMGYSIVGPLKLSTQQIVAGDKAGGPTPLSGLVGSDETAVACDVPADLQAALGACGGVGATTATDTDSLSVVERSVVLSGSYADIREQVLKLQGEYYSSSVADSDKLINTDTTLITLHVSILDTMTNIWMGVELRARTRDGGAAHGSLLPEVEVVPVSLFTSRFPPSITFEVVVGVVAAVQGALQLHVEWKQRRGVFSGGGRSGVRIAELALWGLLVWILVLDIQLREEMEDARAAIVSMGRSDGEPKRLGVEPANGAPFIDIMSLARGWHLLSDVIAITLLLGSSRIVRYMRVLPALGPMLVAVLSTLTNTIVVLYLCLLGGTMVAFAVAFHVAIGSEALAFSSIPVSVVSLFTLSVGEVSILDEAVPRVALTILFLSFVMFLAIVLLNLFIGVITDVYPAAKANSERDWDNLITGMMEDKFRSNRRALKRADRDTRPPRAAEQKETKGGKYSSPTDTRRRGSLLSGLNIGGTRAGGVGGGGGGADDSGGGRAAWRFVAALTPRRGAEKPDGFLGALVTPRTPRAFQGFFKEPDSKDETPSHRRSSAKVTPAHKEDGADHNASFYSSMSSAGDSHGHIPESQFHRDRPSTRDAMKSSRPQSAASFTFGQGGGMGVGEDPDLNGGRALKWDNADFAPKGGAGSSAGAAGGESKRDGSAARHAQLSIKVPPPAPLLGFGKPSAKEGRSTSLRQLLHVGSNSNMSAASMLTEEDDDDAAFKGPAAAAAERARRRRGSMGSALSGQSSVPGLPRVPSDPLAQIGGSNQSVEPHGHAVRALELSDSDHSDSSDDDRGHRQDGALTVDTGVVDSGPTSPWDAFNRQASFMTPSRHQQSRRRWPARSPSSRGDETPMSAFGRAGGAGAASSAASPLHGGTTPDAALVSLMERMSHRLDELEAKTHDEDD